ncbi:cupredoxin domain-containing protein [Gracilimonas mengyeensis]|uniref:Plastocyanin n=1 Tax=Gracilimonas mengyeensis TaxID=1302730 RepID=A0A521BIJ0_9BACT|nr:plastocyanin/azurin family copper-binding protein [Gracilimonas mengyeensis]SMO46944.1 Plastocyanin [Gracilimonas mengyeensis]
MLKYYLVLLLMILSVNAYAIPSDTVSVTVWGTGEDARFEPAVVQVQPGDVIRFEVKEGLHTVTAYHPENRRPQRIPEDAAAFNSGMLQTGQTWFLKLNTAGMYDYFCLPHERMGHLGRIFVGPIENISGYPVGRIPASALIMLDKATQDLINP